MLLRMIMFSLAPRRLAKLLGAAVLLTLGHSSISSQTETDRLSKSTLVFKGTVIRLQATTLAMLPPSPDTIVVKVDSVIRTTDATTDYAGREVTIRLSNPAGIAVGDKYIFYTRGWVLSEGIGLVEIDRKKVPLAASANNQLLSAIMAASQDVDNKLLQLRVQSADLVVQGKVISTERVDLQPLAGSSEKPRQISEHNPGLKKATIEVTGVLSLDPSVPKVITVLYPSSHDVAWLGAPRFERGDTGVFVLSKAGKSPELKEFLMNLKVPLDDLNKSFVTPNPVDFQPKLDPRTIQSMIKPRINQPFQ